MTALNWSRTRVVDFHHRGGYVNPRNVYANPWDMWSHAHSWTVNLGDSNYDRAEVGIVSKGEVVIRETDAGQLRLHLRFDPGPVRFDSRQFGLLTVG